jgi:hypothetical protein
MVSSVADISAGVASSVLLSHRWIGSQRDIRIASVPFVWEKSQPASWGLSPIQQATDRATKRGNDAG